jgi:hypothetical protein
MLQIISFENMYGNFLWKFPIDVTAYVCRYSKLIQDLQIRTILLRIRIRRHFVTNPDPYRFK